MGNFIKHCLMLGAVSASAYAENFYAYTNYDPDLPKNNLDYDGFANPSGMSRVQTWWHWVDGNVSREGIERDLAEMADKGYGAAIIFQFGIQFGHDYIQPGPLKFASPEWFDTFSFVVDTAVKNNMQIGIHNCDGWTEAAGPWIDLENSMKILTWSKAFVSGDGREQEIPLARPNSNMGFYRDIAVIAWPSVRTAELKMSSANKKLLYANAESLPDAQHPLEDMLHGNGENLPHARVVANDKYFDSYGFAIEFEKPFEAASVFMRTNNWRVRPQNLWLEASNDGKNFERVAELAFNDNSVDSYEAFKPRKAKYWRVMRYRNGAEYNENDDGANLRILDIMEFELLARDEASRIGAGIKDYRRKANLDDVSTYNHGTLQNTFGGFENDKLPVPKSLFINPSDVKVFKGADVSSDVFKWKVPQGNWEVMRLGYTTNGRTNDPATDAGRGLELDKFSKEALDIHFNAYVKKMIDAAGDKAGSVFKYIETDSWECGVQNWTVGFDEMFKDYNGYDFFEWAPTLDGNIVKNKEETEAFFADFRRATSRAVMDNFYGHYGDLIRNAGLLYETEPSVHSYMQEWPETFKRADIPQDEMWQQKRQIGHITPVTGGTRFMGAPSTSHFYGKEFTSCESISSMGGDWANVPATVKGTLDKVLLAGYNLIVFHSYVHQPDERKPGWQMEPWGTAINRKQTWWPLAKPFFAYLNRSQHMLQKGRPDVKILNLYADEIPAINSDVETPHGILTDVTTGESVRNFLKVEDGKLVSPGKMQYELLAISPNKFMRAETLRAIKKYVEDGATVSGYFYDDYETRIGGRKAQAEWKRLNKELFGGGEKSVRKIGKGTVYANYSLVEAAEAMNIAEAVRCEEDILWTKRIDESGRAWYWILNDQGKPRRLNVSFDVSGKKPYIWNAEDGGKKPAWVYREKDGRTEVELILQEHGNLFVVFENEEIGAHITGYSVDGKECFPKNDDTFKPLEPRIINESTVEFFEAGNVSAQYSNATNKKAEALSVQAALEIKPPFAVEFDENLGAPKSAVFEKLESWTENENIGIRHYSGMAAYKKEFEAKAPAKNQRAYLSFDNIAELAEIYLNGKLAGTLWKAPFVVDVSDFLKDGKNTMEVRVANTWVNRCLYDATLPEAQRLTWGNNMRFHYPAADQHVPWGEAWKQGPIPSGIMGKVQITYSQLEELK